MVYLIGAACQESLMGRYLLLGDSFTAGIDHKLDCDANNAPAELTLVASALFCRCSRAGYVQVFISR